MMKTAICLAALAACFPLASCFTAPGVISSARSTSALSACDDLGRRGFVRSIASAGAASLTSASILPPVANAGYGSSSKIVVPSYIDYLIEKNAQTDPADMLYKGPDPETQLRRIGEAGSRIPEIAALAEDKKWSQVQGIITGPLGTLLQTMNNVANIAGTKEAKDAAKVVKNDLLEINAAAGKRDSASCTKAAAKADKDLEKFVKVAFK